MSWIKVIGINLLLILVLIVLVESFLGKWGDNDTPNLEYQIFNKTYIDRSLLGVKPEQITIYPKSNGFRYASNTNIGKNKDCLIVTIGGSTTQEFILSQEETWSQQLQNALNYNKSMENSNCTEKYIVMNLGMSGHNIFDNFWLLKNYIHNAQLKPAAIVVYQGINDWHTNLNHKSSYIKSSYIQLREIKQEVVKDIKYRSFIFNTIRKITNYFSEDPDNHMVDNNYNDDGFLFRIQQPHKVIGEFIYEELDSKIIADYNEWGGTRYHKRTVQRFLDFAQAFLPKTKLVFITQTKSSCDLRNFPGVLGYKKSNENTIDISPNQFNKNEWMSSKGDCFRLGVIKQNYISVVDKNPAAEVIDYAGEFVELPKESYDNYHKNPYGSKLFFNRIEDKLLHVLEKNN